MKKCLKVLSAVLLASFAFAGTALAAWPEKTIESPTRLITIASNWSESSFTASPKSALLVADGPITSCFLAGSAESDVSVSIEKSAPEISFKLEASSVAAVFWTGVAFSGRRIT